MRQHKNQHKNFFVDNDGQSLDNNPQSQNDLEGVAAVKFVQVKLNPELYDLLGKLADSAKVPMGEYLVRLVAEKAARPELGYVPRKRMGRPRKVIA